MCSKPAKVEVNGRHYCAIHDPAAALKRRQKSDAKYHAENEAAKQKRAAHKEMQRRADCYPGLLGALQGLLEHGMTQARLDNAQRAIAKALTTTPESN